MNGQPKVAIVPSSLVLTISVRGRCDATTNFCVLGFDGFFWHLLKRSGGWVWDLSPCPASKPLSTCNLSTCAHTSSDYRARLLCCTSTCLLSSTCGRNLFGWRLWLCTRNSVCLVIGPKSNQSTTSGFWRSSELIYEYLGFFPWSQMRLRES